MTLARFGKRYGGALFALGLLLIAFPSVARQIDAHAAGTCQVADFSLDSEERQFVELLNTYRQQHGLRPLTVSESLTRASAWLVVDLSSKNYFSHTDSLGRAPQARVEDCGYRSPAGENIAAGTHWDTALEAFEAWKASKGHNENMLYPDYMQVGVARVHAPGSQYGWYWATEFGIADDGTNLMAPAPVATPAAPTTPPAPAPALTPTPAATLPPAPSPAATPPVVVPTAMPSLSPAPASVIIRLLPGANLIAWPERQSSTAAMRTGGTAIEAIYAYDTATKTWLRFGPGLPPYVNSLHQLEPGRAYWVIANEATQVETGR